MSYQLVEDLQKKACPPVAVVQACRILEVSRSGYYASQASVKQCSGQVISDSLIGFLSVDSRSKALGDMLPSFECNLTLL